MTFLCLRIDLGRLSGVHLVYHLSLVCGSVWGKVLCARMEDQLGIERDCFGAGNRRGLTVYLLPHPREKVSSGRRCCRAGLVPGPREVRMEGKGGNAISRKAVEGSYPVTA